MCKGAYGADLHYAYMYACVCMMYIYIYIYVQIIPRRTPLRVKMSPPRAGTAVLQQTPETLSSYAFSS